MSLPRVAILYLCHGNRQHVPAVVQGLAAQTFPHDRLTVVMLPAASPDDVAEYIRGEVLPRSGKDLPETILLDTGKNEGFAKNNNVGITWALERGFDYVFLHNGDLRLGSEAIAQAVKLAESSSKIGSVQSFVTYWYDEQTVNISGGVVHIAGYGYARDNREPLAQVDRPNGEELAYSSGAAVLYRSSALRHVGLLEEGFFMYHEDLELGTRLRFAGYSNVLARHSLAYHDYHFSRNPKKFAWMELYRWVVMLAYYKWRTLLLFSPLLLMIELGTWFMAWRGGWLRAKFWALGEWCKPKTWRLLVRMRGRAQGLRLISDRTFLRYVTGKIEGQEAENVFLQKFVNPLVDKVFRLGRILIFW